MFTRKKLKWFRRKKYISFRKKSFVIMMYQASILTKWNSLQMIASNKKKTAEKIRCLSKNQNNFVTSTRYFAAFFLMYFTALSDIFTVKTKKRRPFRVGFNLLSLIFYIFLYNSLRYCANRCSKIPIRP